MRFKLLAFVLLFPFSVVAQEQVETTGVGVADTMVKACEIALDHARREAAQSATAIVSAEYQSTETDKGVSHRQDQISTTKAFAKLIDKKESFTLDGESGLIKCNVVASFKAGFVEVESNEKIGSSTTDIKAVAFTSGEPFCSKSLNGCFREYYSKELNVFGIQYLKGDHFYLNPVKHHEKRYFLITEVSKEVVSSKEKFIQLMREAVSKRNDDYVKGVAKGYTWGKQGYKKRATEVSFESYRNDHTFPKEVSKSLLKRMDASIQKTLDLAAEF